MSDTNIDPKRYEGHALCLQELKEIVNHADFSFTEAGRNLIQDAPLLLAEVERLMWENADLREKLEKGVSVIRQLKVVSYDLNMIPSIVAMRVILESDGVVEFLAELKEE